MDIYNDIYAVALNDLSQKGFPNAAFLAKCVVCQAAHESGNWTSDIYKNSNNMFGYKYTSLSDWQIKNVNYKGYGKYLTPSISVHELTSWLGRRYSSFAICVTIAQYAQALKAANYYEDSSFNYTAGMYAAEKKYSGFFIPNTLDDVVVTTSPTGSNLIYIVIGAVLLLFTQRKRLGF